ncbi:uncharacterized protein E0L32_008261 [Thyridium curvatum]|uniref:Mitochondrial distribution and morphology protein 34 n=1 Tax=Thyridium curvatum TaxID=1093900 RepID=A0A507AM55_9PEZI|nr:uncharacterized protein E0L32_008261 [Thyridium curvatum]TPX10872.1 hypothetical protein E0L32_008261 [Thyridium curvatum]
MAFNFNWSPLTADASFYKRATDLLTAALNKSPKPPIIVDDIIVNELNLGSVPPELEILEIGDLAEDRFRGIFKMCYSGDAFLTLKTKVQANPMNTYLYSKPSFTSPQPLAAASGMTIPLQITLSEIKLSAFIIVVFSKQKGLTLVFRNDPLESLKVSSTFDSIQFVRDYLQRTIEGKLRDLMMDELPAIIHRLSLQLWCPDQLSKNDTDILREADDEAAIDPLAGGATTPAVDIHGHVLDTSDVSALSVETAEFHSLFSQKNLLRLAALTNSHRTLSLFTPGIREIVFRAWANPLDRSETSHSSPFATPSLVRSHSYHGSATTYTFSDTASQDQGHLPSRPSLVSLGSATTGLSLGAGRHAKTGRKKKTRVVNLRRNKTQSETTSEAGETSSDTMSVQGPQSEPVIPASIPEETEAETLVGSSSTQSKVRFTEGSNKSQLPARPSLHPELYTAPEPQYKAAEAADSKASAKQPSRREAPAQTKRSEKQATMSADIKTTAQEDGAQSESSAVMLDQAWIMKMAGEIARRVYDEKRRNPALWDERDEAPPAYEAR